ncbi:hypothetical protein J6590_014913 [Homalodisca vitripennis]|nr:hypothetical protein J6590_014913 [Homalodisca vitripennis]
MDSKGSQMFLEKAPHQAASQPARRSLGPAVPRPTRHDRYDLLQCEYDDSLSTPRQKKPVSRTVGPRPGPWTHCPPLKKQFELKDVNPRRSNEVPSVTAWEKKKNNQKL